MRYLVAGGAGFIGSNLCRRLLEWGNDVLCVDNLSTGKKSNIEDLTSNPLFLFERINIVDWHSLYGCTLSFKPDRIYNVACPASPIKYQKMSVETLETCFLGVENLLKLCLQHKARMLHASTSEVYGEPTTSPQDETYRGNVNCHGPRSCYDEGKRVAESLIYEYNRIWNTDVRIVRIFNTYGPRLSSDDGRVVSNFICQALSNEPLTVYGNGTQTRSLMYIDDLMDGFDAMMNVEENPQIVNLGNPQEITMTYLAHKVISLIPQSTSGITYCELPKDDPTKRVPDINKAKEKLNWSPKVSLEDGLKKTIDFFRNKIDSLG